MDHPSVEDARRLSEWRPPLGVISVYLDVDPGDRGGGWRTALRNGLSGIVGSGEGLDHDARTALRGTAERIAERFATHDLAPSRGEVGFVEVAPGPGRQHWWATHLPPNGVTSIRFDAAPVVAPLLWIAQRGAARGVALVSADRVRLLEWHPGNMEEVQDWELSLFSRDWRERRARRSPDPARAQGVTASGRDQHADRLAENRSRFLREVSRLVVEVGAERGWEEVLAFGSPKHLEQVLAAASPSARPEIALGAESDLISMPPGELDGHVEEVVARCEADRQQLLVGRALEEARGGRRGIVGPQETLVALDEGRVEHLIVAAGLATGSGSPPQAHGERGPDGAPALTEPLVHCALARGAMVYTVSGKAAERLAEADGVAALVRY